jgi:hypothetical protein
MRDARAGQGRVIGKANFRENVFFSIRARVKKMIGKAPRELFMD